MNDPEAKDDRRATHAAIRRMRRGHDAAARRALAALEPPLSPSESFEAAMELCELAGSLLDQPPDAVRVREEAAARARWARLRKALGA